MLCANYCISAFLSDGSLRDNIIGFSSYDERRYAEVIDATMLRFDLENLPSGDRTNIGSNGITLSGGQRQRVSLARALYLHTDLLIFDDVFSGLDADTEDQVFQRVFGTEGLLKRRKTTTLLCTHSIRHLPFADHIVALGQDGTIAEQGAFKQLTENNGYIQSLDIKSSRVSEVSSEITAPSIASLESPTEPLRKVSTIASVSSETDKARQTGDRTVYKHYFKSSKYTQQTQYRSSG
jgi:ABC-type protease/lipase transport system fused ATPase/permease subunit